MTALIESKIDEKFKPSQFHKGGRFKSASSQTKEVFTKRLPDDKNERDRRVEGGKTANPQKKLSLRDKN